MDAIGGGVLVAVAAALWVAYLLPTWFRRGQYLATERNAVRLQQTLRILAETAETPQEVRVEATAREVAAQQRILAEQTERARLEAEAAEQLAIAERVAAEERAAAARAAAERAAASGRRAAAERAAQAAATGGGADASSAAARRALRRNRALCSLVMLISLLVAIAGLVGLAFGWTPAVALGGAAGVVAALSGTVALARRRVPVASVAVAAPTIEAAPFEPIDLPEPVAEPVSSWTPQPLPKPLHLSRGTIAAAAMASVEAAEGLRRASVEAALAARAATLEPELPKLTPRPKAAPAAAAGATADPSRYAVMGVVDGTEPGFESLDAVLRRRREAV
jgi:hypothetical protein